LTKYLSTWVKIWDFVRPVVKIKVKRSVVREEQRLCPHFSNTTFVMTKGKQLLTDRV
jgi:hypothetical protein